MKIPVYVFGNRGSYPAFGNEFNIYGHDTSCYCILDGEYGLVIDCGSGLSKAAPLLKNMKKVDVLLSHVHYDHVMGLFDNPCPGPLDATDFYGDFNAWKELEYNSSCMYRIEDMVKGNIHSIKMDEVIELGYGYSVRFTPSRHSEATSKMDIYKEDKHICYTGDYEHHPDFGIEAWIRGCDLLIFDGTYNRADYEARIGWGHSCWEDACRISRENKVKQLVITHHAICYDDATLAEYERRAKDIFDNVVFSKEKDVYLV